MPPKRKGKKKKKGKKANKKKLLQQQEEERLRLAELARKEAEELRLLQEEQQRKEEEERAKQRQKIAEELAEVREYLQNVAELHRQSRVNLWEKKRWEDYLYKTKEMDPLDLREVNAYITEWDDDPDCDIENVFSMCHRSLKIIETINSALHVYPNEEDVKTRELWSEGISNLREIMAEKLDYASLMLLKDAMKYLEDKTQNMEYGFRDADDDTCRMTLCLWVNIHRAVRKQGMEMFGYSFRIPTDLAANDCAVRIMHLAFDYISHENLDIEASGRRDVESQKQTVSMHKSSQIKVSNGGETDKDKMDSNKNEMDPNLNGMDPNKNEMDPNKNEMDPNKNKSSVANSENAEHKSEILMSGEITSPDNTAPTTKESKVNAPAEIERIFMANEELPESDPKNISRSQLKPETNSLTTVEIKLLNLREYFLVGGLFHFDLFEVPKLTIEKKGITYIYKENPILKRIPYKRKLPHLTAEVDELSKSVTEILSTEEDIKQDVEQRAIMHDKENNQLEEEISASLTTLPKKLEEEINHDIELTLQLPKNVIFFEQPVPARFCPEKQGFTSDGITDIGCEASSDEIYFKPDQFGIFGMFQRKYINFPYKNWHLKGGEVVELSLTGQQVFLRIQISDEGCRVESMNPSKGFVLKDTAFGWYTADQLAQKLLSFGVNLFVDETEVQLKGNHSKNQKMENDIYSHMALLSKCCDFSWSKWNSILPQEEFVLKFRSFTDRNENRNKETFPLALICEGRTVQLKYGEEMETFTNEAVESENFFGNFYHLVHDSLLDKFSLQIYARYACIENICTLLRKCRLLSSSS